MAAWRTVAGNLVDEVEARIEMMAGRTVEYIHEAEAEFHHFAGNGESLAEAMGHVEIAKKIAAADEEVTDVADTTAADVTKVSEEASKIEEATETPEQEAAEAPAEEEAAETPAEETAEAPAEEEAAETPAEETAEAPAEEEAGETPAEETAEAPAEVPVEVPPTPEVQTPETPTTEVPAA
jgi:hypothetical protein